MVRGDDTATPRLPDSYATYLQKVTRMSQNVRAGRLPGRGLKRRHVTLKEEASVKSVFVIGAGPAGLYATQKLARAGHSIFLFNRDIKPGGLAEYGIYPTKEKMKGGLRKLFGRILEMPNVAYFGHSTVASGNALTIDQLREWNPGALVFAVGAQGTKKLGLPGEDCRGVYSAKDFVYNYNLLPPFTSRDFSTGKRVAVIGMGNVMVDLAHWLLVDDPNQAAEEVIVIARRGPFEAKFDRREFDYIEEYLDCRALEDELGRIKERIAAVGQDTAKVAEASFPALAKPRQDPTGARLRFHFLSSPTAIHADKDGRIDRLTITENELVPRNGGTTARATDKTSDLEVDTLIFAIGDVVDPTVGLPSNKGTYLTNPDKSQSKQAAYEVFDPQSAHVVKGTYVVGWARKASEGVVGKARYDAEQGVDHILEYLEGLSDGSTPSAAEICTSLDRKGIQSVTQAELGHLARAEQKQAAERGVPSFKFGKDKAMLDAIEAEKSESDNAAA